MRSARNGGRQAPALESARGRRVRASPWRGKGGVFCAGGDLKNFRGNFQGGASRAEIAESNSNAGKFFTYLNTMPQVVVMSIEGAAIAGGLGMACTGDVVAVTADAKFAITETSLGIPPAQIAPFVVQRIGLTAARRLMLTGARFDGREAGTLGLADFVAETPPGMDRERGDSPQQSALAPRGQRVTKEIVLKSTVWPRTNGASPANVAVHAGRASRRGHRAFLDKRKRSWAESPDAG